MAKASEAELKEVISGNINLNPLENIIYMQAFKLFDTDGDGVINHEEILALISKVLKVRSSL